MAKGHGDPNISSMAHLEQVLRGIKGLQAKTVPKQARLPITPELLLKIRQVWSAADGGSKWDNIMLWAACVLCFFGFLRFWEITVPSDSAFDDGAHLPFSDVAVDSTKNPKVLWSASKPPKRTLSESGWTFSSVEQTMTCALCQRFWHTCPCVA